MMPIGLSGLNIQKTSVVINYGSALLCGYSSLGEGCSQVAISNNTFQAILEKKF